MEPMSSIQATPDCPEAPAWRARRRARIVAAAVGHLADHPVEDVSMDALAAAAGVGKATLYRYFETKEGLLRACLDDVVRGVGARIEAAEESAAPAPERLAAIVGAMVETFSRHLLPLRLITRRQSELHEEWRRSVLDARHALVGVLRRHFERGTAAGLYRPVDAELVPHMIMGLIRSGVTHTTGRSQDEITEAICALVLRGCAGGPCVREEAVHAGA